MTPPVIFGAGLVIGTAAGLLMGRDLAKCTARMMGGESRAWLAFGLFRRMAIMAGALAVGLAMGKPGIIGAAAGVGAGYLAAISFAVRGRA